MTYYTTVTAKGQITLPAKLRQGLGVRAGQRVTVRAVQDSIVVEPVLDIVALRAKTRLHLAKSGFSAKKLQQIAAEYSNGDGMAAYTKEKYGQS